MKVVDALVMAEPFISRLLVYGVKPRDVQYLALYDEYREFCKEGLKITYIEATLCEKYAIGRSKFYEIVRKFDEEM